MTTGRINQVALFVTRIQILLVVFLMFFFPLTRALTDENNIGQLKETPLSKKKKSLLDEEN